MEYLATNKRHRDKQHLRRLMVKNACSHKEEEEGLHTRFKVSLNTSIMLWLTSVNTMIVVWLSPVQPVAGDVMRKSMWWWWWPVTHLDTRRVVCVSDIRCDHNHCHWHYNESPTTFDTTMRRVLIQVCNKKTKQCKQEYTQHTQWMCSVCESCRLGGRRLCHRSRQRPTDRRRASRLESLKQQKQQQ